MIVLFLQFQAGAKGKEEAGVHLAGKVPLTLFKWPDEN
jgi:hypothetical protein